MFKHIINRYNRIIFILFSIIFTMFCQAADNPQSTSTGKNQGTVRVSFQNQNPVRAFHFVLKPMEKKHALQMVDMAHAAGFNTIIVQLTWGLRLDNAPWKASSGAWSRDEFLEWVTYVRDKGMVVIPEVKLLTHQIKLFQNNYLDLMFNTDTYDPRKEEVYVKVFQLLNEIITLIHPKAIHIGHDEVAGHSEQSAKVWLREGEMILPANLFLEDVIRIHAFLKNRGVETWMWGDMLIRPDEFLEMRESYLHGSTSGYGKTLRDKLPRDIVICDWHYADKQSEFPSISTMKKEGFRVLGATWRNETTIHNFSRYAASHGASGMIATTWFYVPKREWDVVERIIKISGEVFSKDFPDAK